MPDRSPLRERMVDAQLARRGIQDRYVIAAMGKVPREAFVTAALEEFAYADTPLPIGEDQTSPNPTSSP
jgi:protein-L-isoaspartate O-methyltransferase